MTDNNQSENRPFDNNQYREHDHSQPHAQPFGSPFQPLEPDTEIHKHSGIGIASFVLALVAVLLVVIAIIIAVVGARGLAEDQSLLTELENFANLYGPGQETELGNALMDSEIFGEFIATFLFAGVLMLGSLALAFVGLILGIVSAASRKRKKTFGIIGLVLNGLFVVGTIGLFIATIALGMGSV
ncbi:hypothetical protein [Paenibacillus agaridevorans]|uniref:hypothetical protein n=1 Tax=Paenibacillus agaridevorans TaxID=171404 RepID=UPI001BE4BE2E|nr:hypothetical protein [Paenibacillus agaridevorans]